MIIIRKIGNDNVNLRITKGTSYDLVLSGIVVLIETLIEDSKNLTIDYLLGKIKMIYEDRNKKDKL